MIRSLTFMNTTADTVARCADAPVTADVWRANIAVITVCDGSSHRKAGELLKLA